MVVAESIPPFLRLRDRRLHTWLEVYAFYFPTTVVRGMNHTGVTRLVADFMLSISQNVGLGADGICIVWKITPTVGAVL